MQDGSFFCIFMDQPCDFVRQSSLGRKVHVVS